VKTIFTSLSAGLDFDAGVSGMAIPDL